MQKLDLITIAPAIKDIQRRALMATTAEDTHVGAIARLWDSKPIGATFGRDGEIIACAGAVLIHPGVASTFLYATDSMPKVIIEITRFYKKMLFPMLKKLGVHRVHSLGLADDPAGCRWKEQVLGGKPQILEKWGKGGEDFVLHTLLLA